MSGEALTITAFVLGFAFALPYVLCSGWREVRRAKEDSFQALRERLSAYYLMQAPCATAYHPPDNNIDFVPSGMLFSHEQHRILLGVMKKIEAKFTAIVVIVIFALPFLFEQTAQVRGNDVSELFIYATAGILFANLISGAVGASHLGQPHYRKHIENRFPPAIRGRELQRELVNDMLTKEAYFHSSLRSAIVALVFIIAAHAVWFFCLDT